MTKKIMVNVDGVDREATSEEIDSILADQAIDKAKADALKAEAETKAIAKAALLDRLGITEDEAKLLLA
jgi:hypothetical protein